MTQPIRLFCWHFMSYPYAPADFDDKYDTAWITVLTSCGTARSRKAC